MQSTITSSSDGSDHEIRIARLSRTNKGDPIGIALFLTVDALRAIGIDTETADSVAIRIVDGTLELEDETEADESPDSHSRTDFGGEEA